MSLRRSPYLVGSSEYRVLNLKRSWRKLNAGQQVFTLFGWVTWVKCLRFVNNNVNNHILLDEGIRAFSWPHVSLEDSYYLVQSNSEFSVFPIEHAVSAIGKMKNINKKILRKTERHEWLLQFYIQCLKITQARTSFRLYPHNCQSRVHNCKNS